MKNVRGFIDPITLGFLFSLVGTTTALVVKDDNQVTPVTDTATTVEVQTVAAVQIENDYDF